MLLDARPPDQYCFDDGELERYTGRISEMIKSAKRLSCSESQILQSQSCMEARNRQCRPGSKVIEEPGAMLMACIQGLSGR
jgi:hypothetical protein